MLTVYVLNVGHGDSAVLRYTGPNGDAFAVVDSNQIGPGDPPALRKLRELGAERLSFVALTHPHADHYKGLLAVLRAYRGRIGSFYTFPIRGHVEARIERLAVAFQKIHGRTDSPTIRGQIAEFIEILYEAKNEIGLPAWFETAGPQGELLVSDFPGVELFMMAPPARVKGSLFQMIELADPLIAEEREKENDLSLAMLVRYGNRVLILGGDATYENLLDHKKQYDRAGKHVCANVVKLPHHGARHDCESPVLDYLFGHSETKIACISANGHSHPHPDTYKWLAERQIQPYCTNLAKGCGAVVRELVRVPDIDPQLARFINMLIESPTPSTVQACQGDIRIQIDATGAITVTPQYNNPCPYRGGYARLPVTG